MELIPFHPGDANVRFSTLVALPAVHLNFLFICFCTPALYQPGFNLKAATEELFPSLKGHV